jgi:hypothetical protein
MSDQAEGQNQGGQRDGQGGPQGDEGGGIGDGQGGGGLPWLIIMLLSFLLRGTPLHQIRLEIILGKRQSIGV